MKKILFLGASWFQQPPIEWARAHGHLVLTTDNRPQNPGHALANRTFTISTVDREAVLRLAERESVDAVVCYASDVSAPVAAYVTGKLGLPGNPVEAVETLCDKSRFRHFQRQNGFFHPKFVEGGSVADLMASSTQLSYPLIAKPVDASGSKGIRKVAGPADLAPALETAFARSRGKKVVVEEVLDRQGHQLTGDGFLVDGRLVFRAFLNQHFCPSGDSCSPVGESSPADFGEEVLAKVHDEVQALMDALGMRRGALNFDILLGPGGDVRVLEIGPRCGGNHIPLLVRESLGVDLPRAIVEDALGQPVDLSGSGMVVPHASLNLVDVLTSRGLAEQEKPHRVEIDAELMTHCASQTIRLINGSDPTQTVGNQLSTRAFAPKDLDVGFLLFRFQDSSVMLDRMENVASLVRFSNA